MSGAEGSPVQRVTRDDWATLREVRLAALLDAPYAFGASHADELSLDEGAWRARADEQAWFVAASGARPVGVVSGGQLREPEPAIRSLRALWVVPGHCGDGTATRLVDEVVRWAREDGASVVSLWATESAERARAFYARYGFVPTGDERLLELSGHVPMARYELAL